MKPHKVSSYSAHLGNCYFQIFYKLSDWVEILWGSTKFLMLKITGFYLVKQKSFIPKKKFLSRCQYQNKKALLTGPIFSEGFDWDQGF